MYKYKVSLSRIYNIKNAKIFESILRTYYVEESDKYKYTPFSLFWKSKEMSFRYFYI